MRVIAIAAALCVGMTLGGVAAAREWTDPAGRLRFDAPNGWTTTQERGAAVGDTFTYVISGTANNECHFLAQPNAGTASASVDAVRRAAQEPARFGAEFWTTTLNGVASVFPGNSATVNSTSMETDGRWPIQRAEATSPRRPVHAALQLRPGFDLITLCMTYDGSDPVEVYNNVIRSVGHPNDAAFEAAATPAAPTPTPAPVPTN